MFQSFESLEVWKLACQVSVRIFEMNRGHKEASLRNPMQRAAVSIASNIAEGAERGGQDFVRFLKIARGSAAELRTLEYIACKIGDFAPKDITGVIDDLKRISKMLTGLANSVKKKQTHKPTES
jgi:four helix bundle protein